MNDRNSNVNNRHNENIHKNRKNKKSTITLHQLPQEEISPSCDIIIDSIEEKPRCEW